MIDRSGARERRHHARVCPKGTVIFEALGHSQRGRVINISQGGLFVRTPLAAPSRLLDRTVIVELRIDAASAQWLAATGVIMRIESEGLAVAFDPPPAAFVRTIRDLAVASVARAGVVSVVLIDAQDQRRSALAAGFRATGCSVVEVATPLEAIVRLGEATFEPDVIAFADAAPSRATDEMRAFVETAHPSVRLVPIGDEILQPDGFSHWLSAANRRTQ